MTGITPNRSRRLPPHASAEPRACEWPGCGCDAAYPAPRGRDRLREFQWFCLDHIREFNRGWDFFKGMSTADIEAHQRADVTWHRPSWHFGTRTPDESLFDDLFELFGQPKPRQPQRPRTRGEEMMDVLGLSSGFTLDELKSRYKTLAKQHHPDLHGGDKEAEERLKGINEAYTYLKQQRLYAAG